MKKIFLILILLFTILLLPNVYAKENITYETKVENDKLYVTYTVGDDKVYGITSELSYDESQLQLESCEGKNGFTVTSKKNDTLMILSESVVGKKNTDIVECIFNIKQEDSNITFLDINSSDSSVLTTQQQKKVVNLLETSNTGKQQDMPYTIEAPNTGKHQNMFYMIVALILIVLGLCFIVFTKKVSKKAFLILFLLIPTNIFAEEAYDTYTENQLNEIRNIILNKTENTKDLLDKYDLDADNKITINDLIKVKIIVNTPTVDIQAEKEGTGSYYTKVKINASVKSLTDITEVKYCIGNKECTPNTVGTLTNNKLEVSLPNSNTAQKFCIEVKNKVGLSKKICDASEYKVDNVKPSFDLKSSSVTILSNQTYNTNNNVENVKYGLGGGNITCTSATAIGTHTITCTAKGNNNLQTTKTYTLIINEKIYKALFVGNSKTYMNDIPEKFKAIAVANGYKVEVTSVTEGGKTLEYMAENHKTELESVQGYDFLILQEQTAAYSENYDKFLKGAKDVIDVVKPKNSNIKVFLRQTWVNAEKTNDNWYYSANLTSEAYLNAEKVASNTNATLIYDGKAFKKSTEDYPSIILFQDDRHQTEAGAYLSAACIYKKLFNKSPVGTTYKAGLSDGDANKLLAVAANVG